MTGRVKVNTVPVDGTSYHKALYCGKGLFLFQESKSTEFNNEIYNWCKKRNDTGI